MVLTCQVSASLAAARRGTATRAVGEPPIHIEAPNVDGKLARIPTIDLILDVHLRKRWVELPLASPSPVGVVREEGRRPSQPEKFATTCPPFSHAVPQQENVYISDHSISKIISTGRLKLCATGSRLGRPFRWNKSWPVLDRIRSGGEGRRPMEQVVRRVSGRVVHGSAS